MHDDYHLKPGPLSRLLCRIFGHTHAPYLYFRPGQRSVTDGIGRLHINVEGECERCKRMVEFGQLHVPNGPWFYDHATRTHKQIVPPVTADMRREMGSWFDEHPAPVTIKEAVDADAMRTDARAPGPRELGGYVGSLCDKRD